MRSIDVIVPLYNEAAALVSFHRDLKGAIAGSGDVRFIYVNDGSTDQTQEVAEAVCAADSSVCVLELSRNFGHQAALSAGLSYADRDIVIMMDGDGQHPPSLLPEMLRLYESGYDVVQAQRLDRGYSFKTLTSRLFYWLINVAGGLNLAAGTSDFRLISRKVLMALRDIGEYHRFYRGIIPWLGFRTAVLPYEPGKRIAGVSKYSLRKMLKLAGDGVFSFSLIPLKLGIFVGIVFMILAAAEVLYVGGLWMSGRRDLLVPGWSSLILVTTVGLGAIMILLGFIGVYVGMIFQEAKRRPVYVLRSVRGGGVAVPGSRATAAQTGGTT